MRLPGVSLGPITVTGSVKQVTGSPPVDPITVVSAYYTGTAIASGNSGGGDAVTITGTGFIYAVTSVTFGGQAATSVVLVDAETITCVTPAHAAGAVDVVVNLANGATGTGSGIYTYADLALNSITPSSGSTAGNSLVALAGAGFQSGMTVTIGGTSCTSITYTPTTITCRTPAKTAAAYDVVVDGTATLAGGYTYAAPTALDLPVYGAGLSGETLHLQETWAGLTDIDQLNTRTRSDGGLPWNEFYGGVVTYGSVTASPDPLNPDQVNGRYITLDQATGGPMYVGAGSQSPNQSSVECLNPSGHAAPHWGSFAGAFGSEGPVGGNVYAGRRGFRLALGRLLNMPTKFQSGRGSVVIEIGVRFTGSNAFDGKAIDMNGSAASAGAGRFIWEEMNSSQGVYNRLLTNKYYNSVTKAALVANIPPWNTSTHEFQLATHPNSSLRSDAAGGEVRCPQNRNYGLTANLYAPGAGGTYRSIPPSITASPNADSLGTATPIWGAGWRYMKFRITPEAAGGTHGNGRVEVWVYLDDNSGNGWLKTHEWIGDPGEFDEGGVPIDPTGSADFFNTAVTMDFYNLPSTWWNGGCSIDIGYIRIWSHDRLSL